MNEQSFNLNELSRLAFSEPITWLSIEPDRDVQIGWFAISIDEAAPSDVFLIPSNKASSQTLLKAQQNGVSAVLLLGGNPPAKTKVPADLPIASVPGDHDLIETQRILLTILINQRAALQERGARVHAQLSQLEADGQGLKSLVSAIDRKSVV